MEEKRGGGREGGGDVISRGVRVHQHPGHMLGGSVMQMEVHGSRTRHSRRLASRQSGRPSAVIFKPFLKRLDFTEAIRLFLLTSAAAAECLTLFCPHPQTCRSRTRLPSVAGCFSPAARRSLPGSCPTSTTWAWACSPSACLGGTAPGAARTPSPLSRPAVPPVSTDLSAPTPLGI